MSLGGWVISVFALILALVLFVPFLFTIDSEQKKFYLRWFLFSLFIDLSAKRTIIGFAGIRHEIKKKRPSAAPAEAPPPPEEKEEGKRSVSSLLSVILSHRSLLIDLARKTVRYLIALLRSFSVRDLRGDFSSKDPVVDGICYGAIQGVQIKKVHLSVSFGGENRVVGRFSLMLFRLIIPTTFFLIRLPYMELYRLFKEIRRKDLPEEAEGVSAPS